MVIDPEDAAADAIAAWLQAVARPLGHIEPGGLTVDLGRFAEVAARATVIGLGEATHGTHEFFLLKHRLVEFLVTELGFDTFALESSHAAGERLDAYVVDGVGDPALLLTEQGYIAWDTEEFLELLRWLRRHNATLPRERRVRFRGVDLNYNGEGRIAVLAWLRQAAADLLDEARRTLDELGAEEARWPQDVDDAARDRLRSLVPRLDTLVEEFRVRSLDGDDRGQSNLDRLLVMRRWLEWVTGEPRLRSQFMGESTVRLLERRPGARVVVWAHNAHVTIARPGGVPSLGAVLREAFGDRYVGVGFESAEGTYLGRSLARDGRFGQLDVAALPRLGPRSLAGRLVRADVTAALIDLHPAALHAAVDGWLREPVEVHDLSWLLRNRPPTQAILHHQYDMFAFVAKSTPTHPTASAVRRAAASEGL